MLLLIVSLFFAGVCLSQVCDAAPPAEREVTAADMPRIPPTEPDAALATFRLAEGFRLELVAAEPMVSDPVDACFDEHGRMFVAEMHGYPFSQEPTRLNPDGGGRENAGIIRMLEDRDGDGRMDQSTVFADGISWPTSVCCFNGGVFVLAPQYLYYLRDTDNDGRADVREEILSGFGRGNVQAVTNGLLWGLDNRIYFAAGRNPATLRHRREPLFDVRNADLRFNPRTEHFETVTGGLQFGHSRDDWGVRFVCSNSNHIQQIVFPSGYLSRNPYFTPPASIRSIAADGASARVYRRSPPEPWRIIRQKWRAAEKGYRLIVNDDGGWEFVPLDGNGKTGAVPTEYPVGYFTSATGITVYRGDAYPQEFYGNAFVGDVGGNLVHRKSVDTSRTTYQAQRADQNQEFLSSTDNWFRPVNFVNAPDGCLYVLDMYRETIEHPYSIPSEIKKFLDLTSGHDRGRIYRIVGPNGRRNDVRNLASLPAAQLVDELRSRNCWNRETAQRLIWERQDHTVVPYLETLLKSDASALAGLHALYALKGLGQLKAVHLRTGLKAKHPRLRAHAVMLSEDLPGATAELLPIVKSLIADDDSHVRLQTALSLGEFKVDTSESLAAILADERNDADIRAAVYSSAGRQIAELGEAFVSVADLTKPRDISSLSEICRIAGANPDSAPVLQLLVLTTTSLDHRTRFALLNAVCHGLLSRGTTLADVISEAKSPEALTEAVQQIFSEAARIVENPERDDQDRLTATETLAFAPSSQAIEALGSLLAAGTSNELQIQAVRSLGLSASPSVGTKLLSGWRSYSPNVRREIVAAMLSVPVRLQQLLDAVEAGAIGPSEIELTARQQLMEHRAEVIQSRSRKLFGTQVNTNRSAVVEEYQKVLKIDGDRARGEIVFRRVCAVCHKVGAIGHQVAPNLESVSNKSEADLLIAILDPNRESQPNFNSYTILTTRGRSYSGIIASESASAITLRRAEAREDVVLRSNVEEMLSSGKSLMPEGLEKELSFSDLADVIAFVKGIGR